MDGRARARLTAWGHRPAPQRLVGGMVASPRETARSAAGRDRSPGPGAPPARRLRAQYTPQRPSCHIHTPRGPHPVHTYRCWPLIWRVRPPAGPGSRRRLDRGSRSIQRSRVPKEGSNRSTPDRTATAAAPGRWRNGVGDPILSAALRILAVSCSVAGRVRGFHGALMDAWATEQDRGCGSLDGNNARSLARKDASPHDGQGFGRRIVQCRGDRYGFAAWDRGWPLIGRKPKKDSKQKTDAQRIKRVQQPWLSRPNEVQVAGEPKPRAPQTAGSGGVPNKGKQWGTCPGRPRKGSPIHPYRSRYRGFRSICCFYRENGSCVYLRLSVRLSG